MINIKTIALLVVAIAVTGAAIVISGVTDINISDAFASARIDTSAQSAQYNLVIVPKKQLPTPIPTPRPVPPPTHNPTPNPNPVPPPTQPNPTPNPNPVPPPTKPNPTPNPNPNPAPPPNRNPPPTQNPTPTPNPVPPPVSPKPRARILPTDSIQPVQPTKPIPGYEIRCPQGFKLEGTKCTLICTGSANNIFGNNCNTPLPPCLDGFVRNPISKQCEKPAEVKCPNGQVNRGGVCMSDHDTCRAPGTAAVDKSQCCSGILVSGICSSIPKPTPTPPPTNPGIPPQKCAKIGDPLLTGQSCCGLVLNNGKCVPQTPSIPKPPETCPVVNTWCTKDHTYSFGRSGEMTCSEVFYQGACNKVVKTLVPRVAI